MSLSHLVGVLKRRWIVVLAGVLLTMGACVAATRVVPSELSSTSTMLLLPPVNTTEPGANPYLSLAGLTGPAEVVSRSVSDPATDAKLRQAGASGTWTVERDYQTSAPIILVTVTDSSIEKVRATSNIILGEVPKALDQLQASINVPSAARITSTVVNRDADVQRVLKPLLRALMLVLAAGLILTVALAALLDAVLLRRRHGQSALGGRRRARGSGGAAPSRPADRSSLCRVLRRRRFQRRPDTRAARGRAVGSRAATTSSPAVRADQC